MSKPIEPVPDQWGRYRVRRKGGRSAIYSTRLFMPDVHVIVPGPASDTYGAALPSHPYRKPASLDAGTDPDAAPDTTRGDS